MKQISLHQYLNWWFTIVCWQGIIICTFTIYNARWVQICGSTSLIDNFNISNLILGTLMNRDNLSVTRTLQHRQGHIWIFEFINRNFSWVIRMQINLEDQPVHLKAELGVSWNMWINQSYWKFQQITFDS